MPVAANAATVTLDTTFDATSIGGSSSEDINIQYNYDENVPLFDPAPIAGVVYRYDAGIDMTVTVGAETVSVTGGGVTVVGDGSSDSNAIFSFSAFTSNHIAGRSSGTIFGEVLSGLSILVEVDANSPVGEIPTAGTPLTSTFQTLNLEFGTSLSQLTQITNIPYADGQLQVIAPVPLPAGLPLLLVGMTILGLLGRRRGKMQVTRLKTSPNLETKKAGFGMYLL